MLRPRIIPCLLIKDGGLVKTTNFNNPKYVGDPLNAVKIFNEKQVDEIVVLDIDATAKNREPNYELIAHLASECQMPLCYGGGIKSPEQIERIIGLGVEKVALGSGYISHPELISDAASRVGNQSIVAVLDVKKSRFLSRYEVFTHNGSRATGLNPVELSKKLEALGVGEIVINSIDMDGTMQGYDINLISKIRKVTNVPITALGGAGSLDDIRKLIDNFGIIGAAAGSLFVFKGKYRAVLINYPTREEKESLLFNKG